MKRFIVMGSVLITALCYVTGCGSQIGGAVYDDKRASVQNQITKDDMNSYINPAESVYK